MGKAKELRKQLDERTEAERQERTQRAKEARQHRKREARALVPRMLEACFKECEKENENGLDRARLMFDGYVAQSAAPSVIEKLEEEGFKASYSCDTYGFRVDGDGYVLSEGTPYVSIEISW